MFIQISTNNSCQLKCNWCMMVKQTPETMGFGVLEYVVDEYVDTFGSISMVDMTPIVGELTQTPDWLQMLDYLERNDGVERFEYVTNFLDYDKDSIRKLLKHNKFGLFISVYGHDRQSFFRNTNVDMWDKFVESLTNLQECMSENNYECFPITFYFRDLPYDEMPHDSFAYKFLRAIQLVSKNDVVFDSSMSRKNYNWAGQMEVPNPVPLGDNDGICLHAVIQNCVFPDGDITLCGMVDVHKKMVIGNIFETPLVDIYAPNTLYDSYMNQSHPMCDGCTEFESTENEPEDVKKHEDKLNKSR